MSNPIDLPDYTSVSLLVETQDTVLFRAKRRGDGRPVILKTLSAQYPSPGQVRMLRFEHRVLVDVAGPGVIEVVGLEQHGRVPVVVLEDFGAKSLDRCPLPLSLEQFFPLARQAVQALGRIHQANVVHKDIKPANLVVNDQTGQLKLIDFALASVVARERGSQDMQRHLEGSLPYLSPEQTGRMNRRVDYRSDYYALGITFFELLTGQRPYEADDLLGWVYCHTSQAIPRAHEHVASIPPYLSELIAKLMAKDSSERYQSAAGLICDLEACETQWKTHGLTGRVTLGCRDISGQFALTQRVVGRSAETQQLGQAFERARQGKAQLMVVTGAPGMGKSSTIGQIEANVAKHGGRFISGKFDQVTRNQPYGALLQAFRQWIAQTVAKPSAEVEAWSKKLQRQLGPGLAVVLQLLPELATIVPPQPAPPALPPVEAQNRFGSALSSFLHCLASPHEPLVVFLDDLQWADASTPDLLDKICSHAEAQPLLVLGAFRPEEVGDGHPVRLAIDRIASSNPATVVNLPLQPLDLDATTQFVARTLHCPEDSCSSLAEVLFEKCQGNPFFSGEFLSTLHRDGDLNFDHAAGRWVWDLEAARRLGSSAGVAELLVRRLNRLSDESRQALQLAACLGHRFDLTSVVALQRDSATQVAKGLWQAMKQGLIYPLDDAYRGMQPDVVDEAGTDGLNSPFKFQHDHIQEAVYESMPQQQREETHLRIGEPLLNSPTPQYSPTERLTFVNHLNLGSKHLSEASQRLKLARLNLQAVQQTFSSAAFGVSLGFAEAGANCLSEEQWQCEPSLRFELFTARIQSAIMAGALDRAEELQGQLASLATDKLERASVHLLHSNISMYRRDLPRAIDAIREGLALLDVQYPQTGPEIEAAIGQGIGKMQAHLAEVEVEKLVELPTVQDPALALAMKMLNQVVPAAVMISPPLFIVAELLQFDLSVRHGLSPYSAKNFVDCGMLQGDILGDYSRAYRLGQAAFAVHDRFDSLALRAPTTFVFAAYVSPWGAPLSEALQKFEETYRIGLDSGDHQHVNFSEALRIRLLMTLGHSLDECLSEATAALKLAKELKATIQIEAIQLCLLAYKHLASAKPDPERDRLEVDALTETIVASGNAQWAFQHGSIQAARHAFLGNWSEAATWVEFAAERLMAASTLFLVPEFSMLQCLVITQGQFDQADEADRAQLLTQCESHLEKLANWAKVQPENFEHNYLLAAAEVQRVRKAPSDEVVRLYEKAAAATGPNFVHYRALATELQSQYWSSRGSQRYSEALLDEAREMYRHWGCRPKVLALGGRAGAPMSGARQAEGATATVSNSMRSSQGARWNTLSMTEPGSQLDISSILKATRAISSEVKTEGLLRCLMATIVESAAAQRGSLLLCEEGSADLVVRARAGNRQGQTVIDLLGRCSLDDTPEICREVVRSVQRTGQTLRIDDASQQAEYKELAYIRSESVRSILCVPVHHQGGLIAALYLENNSLAEAFAPERVQLLELLAGQAAVSIHNALLYEDLEAQVDSRSQALAAKSRHMQAMLEQMPVGVVTLGPELTIEGDYSRHLEQIVGLDNLAGRQLQDLLFTGSDRTGDEIQAHDTALRFSMGAPLAIARINQSHLLRHCVRSGPDGKAQHLELDWTWIEGDKGAVSSVLATIRDVTLLLQLKRNAAANERQATILSSVLDLGLEQFQQLCREARQLVTDCQPLVNASEPAGKELGQDLYRQLHNLKGVARSLALPELVDAAHNAESALQQWQDAGCTGADATRTLQAIATFGDVACEHEQIVETKLGRLWTTVGDDTRQALQALDQALHGAEHRPSYPARVVEAARQVLNHNDLTLSHLLEQTGRTLPSLARQLGKQPPSVALSVGDMRLSPQWGSILRSVLVQTIHNSLAHGIETPSERQVAGKSPQGSIALEAHCNSEGWSLRLRDDGRGLALQKLREQFGPEERSDLDLAESILQFGVSTASEVSHVAGRGVGMDSVRGALRKNGGDVSLRFTGEERDGFRPFELVFQLPTEAGRVIAG